MTQDAFDKKPATNIRKGQVIIYQNAPHMVLEVSHRMQGRQAGFLQVTLRDLKTGVSKQNKYHSDDTVAFCYVETKSLEYAYEDKDGFHFTDTATYEDVAVPASLVKDQKNYFIPNVEYSVIYVEGHPVQVQLPAAITVTVTEASEGLRGDTATNAQKPVIVETGMRIQVPLFVKKGDAIRISTSDGTYLGRA